MLEFGKSISPARKQMQLFTAGPSQSPKEVLEILQTPTIHHRSDEFKALFEKCRSLLKKIINLPHVFCLCSSGSGAMESAISSLNPQKILVLNHGKFSRRWLDIAKAFNIPAINYEISPQEIHSIPKILDYLNEGVDCVCLQTCESSSGTKQDFISITKAIKSHNPKILTLVDGIASFCTEEIPTNNIDVLITSSQKALMLPVGLGFVHLSEFALQNIQNTKAKSFYTSLQNYLKNPIAFSLPSNLFFALKFALEFYTPRLQEQYTLIQKRFEILSSLFEDHQIELYSNYPSAGIIAFHDQNEIIKKKLKDREILISGGQDELKNQISRIGNFGILQNFDLLHKELKNTLN